jgi:hypothetical protein
LFHADGQTDMTKLIVALRNFANAPKNVCKCAAVKLGVHLRISNGDRHNMLKKD